VVTLEVIGSYDFESGGFDPLNYYVTPGLGVCEVWAQDVHTGLYAARFYITSVGREAQVAVPLGGGDSVIFEGYIKTDVAPTVNYTKVSFLQIDDAVGDALRFYVECIGGQPIIRCRDQTSGVEVKTSSQYLWEANVWNKVQVELQSGAAILIVNDVPVLTLTPTYRGGWTTARVGCLWSDIVHQTLLDDVTVYGTLPPLPPISLTYTSSPILVNALINAQTVAPGEVFSVDAGETVSVEVPTLVDVDTVRYVLAGLYLNGVYNVGPALAFSATEDVIIEAVYQVQIQTVDVWIRTDPIQVPLTIGGVQTICGLLTSEAY